MSEKQWKYGLLGCFGDGRLCVLTFLVPCYTVGKNAEGLGEDCLLHGMLTCLGLNFSPVLRWRLRQEQRIQGSMLLDVLTHTVLPCCAMIQEARELGWALPEAVGRAGESEGAGKRGRDNHAATTDAAQPPNEQAQVMNRE